MSSPSLSKARLGIKQSVHGQFCVSKTLNLFDSIQVFLQQHAQLIIMHDIRYEKNNGNGNNGVLRMDVPSSELITA